MNKENKMDMRNAILLSLFVTWIELEDIMLRGVSQAQEGNCRMFSGIDKEAKTVNPVERVLVGLRARKGRGTWRECSEVLVGRTE